VGEIETMNISKVLATQFYSESNKGRDQFGDLALGINTAEIKYDSGVYVVLYVIK
jgi:hypothetical protein